LKLFAGPKVELKVKLAEVSRKEDQLSALQFEVFLGQIKEMR